MAAAETIAAALREERMRRGRTGKRRGRTRENAVGDVLIEQGWGIGSRRHIPGPGDWLAVRADRAPQLIEVKSTAGGPFERFGPSDRAELLAEAERIGAEPVIGWWPPRGKLDWIKTDRWP